MQDWMAGPAILIALLLSASAMARAQGDGCANVQSCVDCLNTQGCQGWAPVAGCLPSCDVIADTSCYSSEEDGVEAVCQAADAAAADSALCSPLGDCESCVATVLLSNDNRTCQWYSEEAFCASECTWIGCGQTTCDESSGTEDACSNITTCVDCLNTDGCGAWTPVSNGTCLSNCSVIQDASCYTLETFPGESAEDTCTAAADKAADAELCSEQRDCGSCVGTILSDGTSTCQWFKDGEYCGSACDMNGSCGELNCTVACDLLETCTDCLNTQSCAWVPVEGCLSSCDIIADTSCFPSEDYNASDVCNDAPVNSDTPTQTSLAFGLCVSIVTVVATLIAASTVFLF